VRHHQRMSKKKDEEWKIGRGIYGLTGIARPGNSFGAVGVSFLNSTVVRGSGGRRGKTGMNKNDRNCGHLERRPLRKQSAAGELGSGRGWECSRNRKALSWNRLGKRSGFRRMALGQVKVAVLSAYSVTKKGNPPSRQTREIGCHRTRCPARKLQNWGENQPEGSVHFEANGGDHHQRPRPEFICPAEG